MRTHNVFQELKRGLKLREERKEKQEMSLKKTNGVGLKKEKEI